MISKEMAKNLNEQINKELFSAYLYQSMSAYSAWKNLKGFANWFQVQAQEEVTHAQKIYKYLLDQGEKVILTKIDAPEIDFKGEKDLFEKTLSHEKTVTASINKLANSAQKENDMATSIFLQWFITEQIEEEANPNEIIAKLEIIGNSGGGIFMLDKELGKRVFNSPK